MEVVLELEVWVNCSGGGRGIKVQQGWGQEINSLVEKEDMDNLLGSGHNSSENRKLWGGGLTLDWGTGQWKWKKVLSDENLNAWIGKKNDDSKCWGLVYSGKSGEKKWRWFEGEIKDKKCKFKIKNKGLGYKQSESGKWERLKENISVSFVK
ncbi:hypothetical protein [Mycoplasma wenyonii]|uniref:hypothetical protein n=1 Tax=Mycoplasma wenyonii TaxID=65123 RepID=UPI0011D233D9|nr:hypothetical protein [Mycoplasma wenyonii]